MIVKAEEQHLNIVREITQHIIDEIYQDYYPIGAVEFFKLHHNDENILVDMDGGAMYANVNRKKKKDGTFILCICNNKSGMEVN